MQTKPSIVFVHGIWADGSSFSEVRARLDAPQDIDVIRIAAHAVQRITTRA